jgi:hypothetical protein
MKSFAKTMMVPVVLAAALVALAAMPAAADGPGALKFDESSFEVLEEAGVVVITVERSHGEDGAVSVDYATADGTATEGADYTGVSGTFTWAHNDGGDRTFTIPILDDSDAEGAETIRLTLSNATGGAVVDAEDGTSVAVILASDGGTGGGGGGDDNGGGGNDDPPGDDNGGGGGNDDPPGDDNGGNGGNDDGDDGDGGIGVFKFDQREFFALESAGVAVVSVERSHGEDGAVSVDYATSDGTATAGSDYTPASGTLSWGAGDESTRVFTVPLADDAAEEGRETVILTLSNPTGGAGLDDTRATAILSILDDDAGNGTPPPPGNDDRPGTLKFGSAGFQRVEGAVEATIRVERSRGEGGTVSVEYAATDGSATDGLDYQATSGVLTWGPGDGTAKTFTVTLFDDDLAEGNETVQLALANATGGASIDPDRGTASLTILDDDGSTAACDPSSSTLCLAQGRFQVSIDWRSPQGNVGRGTVEPVSDRSGLVWFFNQTNVEMLVKVIDACRDFGSYWVFFAATTNVDFTMTVTDTATGIVKQYANPMGQAAAPVQDTFTFQGCP